MKRKLTIALFAIFSVGTVSTSVAAMNAANLHAATAPTSAEVTAAKADVDARTKDLANVQDDLTNAKRALADSPNDHTKAAAVTAAEARVAEFEAKLAAATKTYNSYKAAEANAAATQLQNDLIKAQGAAKPTAEKLATAKDDAAKAATDATAKADALTKAEAEKKANSEKYNDAAKVMSAAVAKDAALTQAEKDADAKAQGAAADLANVKTDLHNAQQAVKDPNNPTQAEKLAIANAEQRLKDYEAKDATAKAELDTAKKANQANKAAYAAAEKDQKAAVAANSALDIPALQAAKAAADTAKTTADAAVTAAETAHKPFADAVDNAQKALDAHVKANPDTDVAKKLSQAAAALADAKKAAQDQINKVTDPAKKAELQKELDAAKDLNAANAAKANADKAVAAQGGNNNNSGSNNGNVSSGDKNVNQANHKKGWAKDNNGRWIWYTGVGNELYNKPGWQKYTSKGYTGWLYENADKSYATNEWKKIGGTWYHFRATGYLDTGWHKIGKRWFYFSKSGKLYTTTKWEKSHGKWMKGLGDKGYATSEKVGKYSFDGNGYLK